MFLHVHKYVLRDILVTNFNDLFKQSLSRSVFLQTTGHLQVNVSKILTIKLSVSRISLIEILLYYFYCYVLTIFFSFFKI